LVDTVAAVFFWVNWKFKWEIRNGKGARISAREWER
jgi:hypothetical protein